MLDTQEVMRRAAAASGYHRPTLAAPFDLAARAVAEALRDGLFGGVIEAKPPASPATAEAAAGWWVDRNNAIWHLERGACRDIVLLGCSADYRIGGQMLLEAQVGGVRRIDLIGVTGELVRTLDVQAEIVARLNGRQPHEEISYRAAYADMLDAFGDMFRLDASAFESDKVVMLIGSLGPGGAERQLAYTAAGIARASGRKVEVGCAHLDPPGDFFSDIVTGAGGRVSPVPARLASFSSPRMMRIRERLGKKYDTLQFRSIVEVVYHYCCYLREARPSVVHAWMDYCNVLGGIAAHLVGIPTLVLAGRSMNPEHFPALFQPYMRPGYELLFQRRRPLFLNNSRVGAENYRQWLGLKPDDFDVVHNGYIFPDSPPAMARDQVRAELGFERSAFVLGAVTRFSEEKDPRLMLDTFKVLHDRFPSMRFVAYGAGLLLEEARRYAGSLGLGSAVRLPGITQDVWSVLDAMDCFILTSRMEGLANVLIEAQAAGLPVVCTGVGGMPETYLEGETGFGAPSRSPNVLAGLVAALAEDRDKRDRISERAKSSVRQRFSVDAMIAGTANCYEKARRAEMSLRLESVRPDDTASITTLGIA